jgi:xanthine dehydrogenase accessory factor
MSQLLLDLSYRLAQAGKPFVLATVVWCERPTSAKPGAQAIIEADGHMTGWIGGSCAQPVVLHEALRVLREGGEPYLLHLGSTQDAMQVERSGVRSFPMSCTSGGMLDIYIEPHFPQPRLILIGDSPVINALQHLAVVTNFAVTVCEQADLSQVHIDPRTSLLIATHGQYDEEALERVLSQDALYVGMVSSRRRADACRAYLREAGLTEEQIARLKAPAGLDIGALTPDEIAASILAELIQIRRRPVRTAAAETTMVVSTQPVTEIASADNGYNTAIDPVCGMTVEIAGARHQVRYRDRDFYFCCPACKRMFERQPQNYLAPHSV